METEVAERERERRGRGWREGGIESDRRVGGGGGA